MSNAPVSNISPDPPDTSLHVNLPDGSTIQSSHSAKFNLPGLPPAAMECHIFPALASGSLLSVDQLCSTNGCDVKFSNQQVKILHQGKTILSGPRSTHNGLWTIDLPSKTNPTSIPTTAPLSTTIPTTSPTCNAVTSTVTKTVAERVAFYHASMFSPTISTWCSRAIDAGHLTTWPELTSKQVRAHLPNSIAMLKGHLDQTRANAQSTKPHFQVPLHHTPATAAACVTEQATEMKPSTIPN
jgi:hypothetical protein